MKRALALAALMLFFVWTAAAHADSIFVDGSFEENAIVDITNWTTYSYTGAGVWHGYGVSRIQDAGEARDGDWYLEMDDSTSFLYQISNEVDGAVAGDIQAGLWLAVDASSVVSIAFYGTNTLNPLPTGTYWEDIGSANAMGTATNGEWVSRDPYTEADQGYSYYMAFITTSSPGGGKIDDLAANVPVPIPGALLLLGSGLLGLTGCRSRRKA